MVENLVDIVNRLASKEDKALRNSLSEFSTVVDGLNGESLIDASDPRINTLIDKMFDAADHLTRVQDKISIVGEGQVKDLLLKHRDEIKNKLSEIGDLQILLNGRSIFLKDIKLHRTFESVTELYAVVNSKEKNVNSFRKLIQELAYSSQVNVFPQVDKKLAELVDDNEELLISKELFLLDENLAQEIASETGAVFASKSIAVMRDAAFSEDKINPKVVSNIEKVVTGLQKHIEDLDVKQGMGVELSSQKLSIEKAREILAAIEFYLSLIHQKSELKGARPDFIQWRNNFNNLRTENTKEKLIDFIGRAKDPEKIRSTDEKDVDYLVREVKTAKANVRNIQSFSLSLEEQEQLYIAKEKYLDDLRDVLVELKLQLTRDPDKEDNYDTKSQQELKSLAGDEYIKLFNIKGIGNIFLNIVLGEYENIPSKNKIVYSVEYVGNELVSSGKDLAEGKPNVDVDNFEAVNGMMQTAYLLFDTGFFKAASEGVTEQGKAARGVRIDTLFCNYEVLVGKFSQTSLEAYDNLRKNKLFDSVIDKIRKVAEGRMHYPKSSYSASGSSWATGNRLIQNVHEVLLRNDKDYRETLESLGLKYDESGKLDIKSDSFGIDSFIRLMGQLVCAAEDSKARMGADHLGTGKASFKHETGGAPLESFAYDQVMVYKLFKTDRSKAANIAAGPVVLNEAHILGYLPMSPGERLWLDKKDTADTKISGEILLEYDGVNLFDVARSTDKKKVIVPVSDLKKVKKEDDGSVTETAYIVEYEGKICLRKRPSKPTAEERGAVKAVIDSRDVPKILFTWAFGSDLAIDKFEPWKITRLNQWFPHYRELLRAPLDDDGNRDLSVNVAGYESARKATDDVLEMAQSAMTKDYSIKWEMKPAEFAKYIAETHLQPMLGKVPASFGYKWESAYMAWDSIAEKFKYWEDVKDADGNKVYDVCPYDGSTVTGRQRAKEQADFFKSMVQWQVMSIFYGIVPKDLNKYPKTSRLYRDYKEFYKELAKYVITLVQNNQSHAENDDASPIKKEWYTKLIIDLEKLMNDPSATVQEPLKSTVATAGIFGNTAVSSNEAARKKIEDKTKVQPAIQIKQFDPDLMERALQTYDYQTASPSYKGAPPVWPYTKSDDIKIREGDKK